MKGEKPVLVFIFLFRFLCHLNAAFYPEFKIKIHEHVKELALKQLG